MAAPHPLVAQLRFTRAEFMSGVRGLPAEDARTRVGAMNCIAWNIGHLAWQEQRYFITVGQDRTPFPEIATAFKSGALGTQPELADVLASWRAITAEADPWLDTLATADLVTRPVRRGRPAGTTIGNLLQRTIYHYWFHNGENQAIRQALGHTRLPQFVGNIDDLAPYTPEPRD